MEENNYSYAEEAANWWAEKIKNSTTTPVRGIASFKKLLAEQIKAINSIRGHMSISTYHSRSKLLDEIAMKAQLSETVPTGYEMRITASHVYIYNCKGQLVGEF